ncbi:MAG: UTP-glucose-1-phosphate uridylyltransferase [Candidatus Magasanikbacteria bacterium GW2011_GWC2_37_14]|uniref:UTP--glucose-1-phosphate uridylyltransferase n=1 Tax=Candidatus Magasanikbacteria bacterium GW2011_GWC2_37_14 TaxID=1619046 RepID=A0A0G0JHE6_9BACT|nr:MAG: UTP-glucose-1-phosphate uridylyltransferase [Candidatus Magasanikbacteria bacterium GW2011_GWC2_37_14]
MKNSTVVRKGVIVAAGLGTRFLPATKAVPKELLPVLDKPVIQYLVEEMANSGITEIILVINKQKTAIIEHFKRDKNLENLLKKANKYSAIEPLVNLIKKVKFTYVYQNQPLGNGQALLCAKKAVGNVPFAFSDGDSIIDSEEPAIGQVIKAFKKVNSSIIGVQKIKDKQAMTKYGNVYVETHNNASVPKVYKVQKIVEKPSVADVSPEGLIIGGMRYVFTSEIWSYLEKTKKGKGGEIWVADAANDLAKQGNFFAYEYKGKYFDTGNKEAMLKTTEHFYLKHCYEK